MAEKTPDPDSALASTSRSEGSSSKRTAPASGSGPPADPSVRLGARRAGDASAPEKHLARRPGVAFDAAPGSAPGARSLRRVGRAPCDCRGACTWLTRAELGLRSGQARRMTSRRATTRGSSGMTCLSASSSGVQISTRSRSRSSGTGPRRAIRSMRHVASW